MALEIAIRRFGGPEVLEARDVPPEAPGKGQIRIRHQAIGVNFTDVHGRRGDYAPLHAMPMPLVLGLEAAGVVEAVGEGVERFRAGDRVAYASGPIGAYRAVRNFPAERCVALLETACATPGSPGPASPRRNHKTASRRPACRAARR